MVAMVFSCVAALGGMGVIVWYGWLDVKTGGAKGGVVVQT